MCRHIHVHSYIHVYLQIARISQNAQGECVSLTLLPCGFSLHGDHPCPILPDPQCKCAPFSVSVHQLISSPAEAEELAVGSHFRAQGHLQLAGSLIYMQSARMPLFRTQSKAILRERKKDWDP